MRWFKHLTKSINDPFIEDLLDRFGPFGYFVFFRTLELFAQEFDPKSPESIKVKLSYFRRILHKSQTNVVKVLDFCQTYSKIYFEITKQDGEEYITLKTPKFAELADEWSTRNKPKLPSDSRVTPELLGSKNRIDIDAKEMSSLSEAESSDPPIPPVKPGVVPVLDLTPPEPDKPQRKKPEFSTDEINICIAVCNRLEERTKRVGGTMRYSTSRGKGLVKSNIEPIAARIRDEIEAGLTYPEIQALFLAMVDGVDAKGLLGWNQVTVVFKRQGNGWYERLRSTGLAKIKKPEDEIKPDANGFVPI